MSSDATKKTNKIKCDECKYSIPTSSSEKTWLCDNPNLPTHCKNRKHGSNFACGYGVDCREKEDKSK